MQEAGMITTPGDAYAPEGEVARSNVQFLRRAGVPRPRRVIPVFVVAIRMKTVVGAAVTHVKADGALKLGLPLENVTEATCLTKMLVSPDHRGKGLGRDLVGCAAQAAQNDGFTRIFGLSEGGDDDRRRVMYDEQGFQTGPYGNPPPSPDVIYGPDASRLRGSREGFFFWKILA